jgi:cell division protein FtsB
MIPYLRLHRLELSVLVGCLTLLGYVSWQGFMGPRGIHFRDELLRKQADAKAVYSTVSGKRLALEQRVEMMRPGTVDADLADELIRQSLNMGGAHDIVVRLDQ